MFKAPCLFQKENSLKQVVTQPAATSPDLADDEENVMNTGSSNEDVDNTEVESP